MESNNSLIRYQHNSSVIRYQQIGHRTCNTQEIMDSYA